MRLDSSGNVGIGTASPAVKLHVSGGVGSTGGSVVSTGAAITMYYDTSNDYGVTSTLSNGVAWKPYVVRSAGMIFKTTSDVEAARLDSSGNLQVGTSAYAYNVFLKSNASNYAAGVVNTSATGPYGLILSLSGVTGGAGGGFLTCVDNANRLLIAGNGNVTNVNGSYGAISDAKLKENITDATPKLESLQQVRIVNFNMKGDEQKQIGVIAQELEQIFPNMVDETIDRDTDGSDLGTTTKNVKYSVFVPMLIKAIQELKAEIDALKGTAP
jgi:hypothetical protein